MAKVVYPARARWLIAALQAAGDKGLTAVQLQKSLFVLGRRRPKEVGTPYYDFQPYDYGPFDASVYNDADYLASHGYVTVDGSRGNSLRTFHLTEMGKAEAAALLPTLATPAVALVNQVVPWAQRLSFEELVRSVYEAFPEMRAKSVFRDNA
jgi:uncharacterized protein